MSKIDNDQRGKPKEQKEVGQPLESIALVSMGASVLEEIYRSRLLSSEESQTDPRSAYRILLDQYDSRVQAGSEEAIVARQTLRETGLTVAQLKQLDEALDLGDIIRGSLTTASRQLGQLTEILPPSEQFISAIVRKKAEQRSNSKKILEPRALMALMSASIFDETPITAAEMSDLCAGLESDAPMVDVMQIPALPARIKEIAFRGRGHNNRIEQAFVIGDRVDMSVEEILGQGFEVRQDIKGRKVVEIQEQIFADMRERDYPDGKFDTADEVVREYVRKAQEQPAEPIKRRGRRPNNLQSDSTEN